MKNILITIGILILSYNLNAQCALACNDQVNISLDSNGEAVLNADMLLFGPSPDCTAFEIEIRNSDNEVLIPFTPNPVLNCAHIGALTYTVRDIGTSNLCWANLTVSASDDLILSDNEIEICVSDEVLENGNVKLDIVVNNFIDIQSMQFSIGWDLEFYSLEGIYNLNGDLDNFSQMSFNANNEGIVSCLWFDITGGTPQTLPIGSVLYSIELIPTFNTENSNFGLMLEGENVLIPEFSNSNGETIPLFFGNCGCLSYQENDVELPENAYLINVVNGACSGYDFSVNGIELSRLSNCVHFGNLDEINSANSLAIVESDNPGYLNGVTTLDLVMFMRSLLDGFNTPMEALLSDFDGNGSVATDDLILIRRVILGIETGEGISHYKIFPEGFTLPADFDHFNIQDDFRQIDFSLDQSNSFNVEVRKSGDLNNSANLNGNNTELRSNKFINYNDAQINAGQELDVTFEINNLDVIKGATFKLETGNLEVIELLNTSSSNELIYNRKDNSIAISYLPNSNLASAIFRLKLKASQSTNLSDQISLNSEFTNTMVDGDYVEYDLELNAETISSNDNFEKEHISIFPNPVKDQVNIQFSESNIEFSKTIELYSTDGKLILSKKTNQQNVQLDGLTELKGLFFLNISGSDLSQNYTTKLIFN